MSEYAWVCTVTHGNNDTSTKKLFRWCESLRAAGQPGPREGNRLLLDGCPLTPGGHVW